MITGGCGLSSARRCAVNLPHAAQRSSSPTLPKRREETLESELIGKGMRTPASYLWTLRIRRAWNEAVAEAIGRFDRIDILVNNAGYNTGLEKRRTVAELADEEWQRKASAST